MTIFCPQAARARAAAVVVWALAASAMPLSVSAACTADSGTTRASLVELYTSEGCSSCPPADRELHRLTTAGSRIVPLALHVDYWDDIGWKDRFAQAGFTQRQQWEVHANQHRTSYTPHFFVNGREIEDWGLNLDGALRPLATPAPAVISVHAKALGPDHLQVQVAGSVAAERHGPHGPLNLYVVVTEGDLVSQVDAGENRGARLAHDAVARQWIGPIAVRDGRASLDRDLVVPSLARGHVGVVAFIQDATTAEVLQAVDTGACRPT